MTSSTMFYYTKVMSELFLDAPFENKNTFRGINHPFDFWRVSCLTSLPPYSCLMVL